jgi:hypothetical protein
MTKAHASHVDFVEVLHICGGCLSRVTKERREFRRTSPLQASSFLSPFSFDEAKEIGSPPVDYRPRTRVQQQTIKKKHEP